MVNVGETADCDITVLRGVAEIGALPKRSSPGGSQAKPSLFVLSVIVRTSPGRSVTLSQTLESLTLQDSKNFELIVVADGMDSKNLARVSNLVDGFRDSLPSKVRLLTTEGGKSGRSAALNTAFEVMTGTHFAVLDDDDLAEPSWVSTFSEVAMAEPERVMRTLCYRQEWVKTGEPPRQQVSPVGPRSDDYPHHFSLVDHLVDNWTPFMTVAYPVSVVNTYGLRIDESLPVLEDWDFLIRAVNYVGLANLPRHTSVYRVWSNRTVDTAMHEQWQKVSAQIRARFGSLTFAVSGEDIVTASTSGNATLRKWLSEWTQIYSLLSKIPRPLRRLALGKRKKGVVKQSAQYSDETTLGSAIERHALARQIFRG